MRRIVARSPESGGGAIVIWQRVTREQLYEQVWSVPIWTLCEQYGLSDNGLRKVCRRLDVPVPPRG